MGQGILAFLSALAQDERERIVKRAQDGRKAAKARGVQFGRKPRLTQHQQAEGRRRLENGESARSIARDFNCHHGAGVRAIGSRLAYVHISDQTMMGQDAIPVRLREKFRHSYDGTLIAVRIRSGEKPRDPF